MTDPATRYREAERTFLASEGVVYEERHADLEKLEGRVRVLAAGDGPPVLFIPGVATSGAVFARLVAGLPDFECLMLDRPGTGLSPLPSEPPQDLPAQRRFADELVADVLDGLGIDRAHVVCTSLGGWSAFRSAAAHPERVIRLCGLAFQIGARVEAAPLTMRVPAPRWMLRRRPPVNQRIVRSLLKGAGMRGAIENGKCSDEMFDWMVRLLRDTDTFANDSLYNARPVGLRGRVAAVQHSPELLGRIECPIHLFWGTDDLFGGEASAAEFASLLPDAELQMVAGAGHAPWLDEPELATEAVRRHLTAGV